MVASHGPVPVPDGDESRAFNERLVELSHGSPDRPRGRRLRLRAVDGWYHAHRYEVVRYTGGLSELPAVPVPDHVARHHPAVRTFLDARPRHIGNEHRTRAARILQAIADEALRHGMVVTAPQVARTTGWRGQDENRRGRLVLRTSAGLYPIRIGELTDPGRLELTVEGPGTAYRGDRYRDTARISLEQRLPGLFLDLETHRVKIERQELERLRREKERQGQWEAAMADARRRLAEQQRFAAVERSSADWRAANQHREFLAVARDAAERYEGPERADLIAHLELAEHRLAALDPLGDITALLPVVRDPEPEDLMPFLRGWGTRMGLARQAGSRSSRCGRDRGRRPIPLHGTFIGPRTRRSDRCALPVRGQRWQQRPWRTMEGPACPRITGLRSIVSARCEGTVRSASPSRHPRSWSVR